MSHNQPIRAVDTREALEMHLQARDSELRDSSLRKYRRPIRYFIDWLDDEHDITTTDEITGFHIEKWKLHRGESVKPITVNNNMKDLRLWIRWCESIEAIPHGTADRIQVPKLDPQDEINDECMMPGTADQLLDYYEKTHRNTADHARFALMWHTGCRISGAMALDLSDFQYDEESGHYFLSFRDRPETGTGLKNDQKSNRDVAILDEEVVQILEAYIQYRRRPVTEESGREPLFTTSSGNRLSRQRAYKSIKRDSRPCMLSGDCPIGKNPSDCEAAQKVKHAVKCEPASPNHPIRKGAITHQLAHGVPKHIVSERCDVSIPVLEKHYDKRTEKMKMHTRLQSDNPFGSLAE
jgi:site-specific recombinase XerD